MATGVATIRRRDELRAVLTPSVNRNYPLISHRQGRHHILNPNAQSQDKRGQTTPNLPPSPPHPPFNRLQAALGCYSYEQIASRCLLLFDNYSAQRWRSNWKLIIRLFATARSLPSVSLPRGQGYLCRVYPGFLRRALREIRDARDILIL